MVNNVDSTLYRTVTLLSHHELLVVAQENNKKNSIGIATKRFKLAISVSEAQIIVWPKYLRAFNEAKIVLESVIYLGH